MITKFPPAGTFPKSINICVLSAVGVKSISKLLVPFTSVYFFVVCVPSSLNVIVSVISELNVADTLHVYVFPIVVLSI